MFRQSPIRGHRSKGIKVKHVLQICVLVAVCFWLIYQVKHSHDKKKELEETDANVSERTQSVSDTLKLGRKDLIPQKEQTAVKIDKPEEEEEAETEEDNKHAEEEQDEEGENEEKDDEGRGAGDDETDESDERKTEAGTYHEEDSVEDEKEGEGGDEDNEEEKEDEPGNGASAEDQEHDGGSRNTHEAREENYKGDDASSAVTHDTQNTGTKTEKNDFGDSDSYIVQLGKHSDNRDEVAANGTLLNTTATIGKASESAAPKAEDKALQNVAEESTNHPEVVNNSTDATLVTVSSFPQNDTAMANIAGAATETPSLFQNKTQGLSDLTQSRNETAEGASLNLAVHIQSDDSNASSVDHSDSHSTSTRSEGAVESGLSKEIVTSNTGHVSDGFSKIETSGDDKIDSSQMAKLSESAAKAGEESKSIPTLVNNASQNDESVSMDGTDEKDRVSTDENVDVVQDDPIDTSDSLVLPEEKDTHLDFDTLPEVKIEVTSHEEVLAE